MEEGDFEDEDDDEDDESEDHDDEDESDDDVRNDISFFYVCTNKFRTTPQSRSRKPRNASRVKRFFLSSLVE